MIIELPRNIKIDTDNVPKDFSDIIRKSFEEYTEGTAKAYTYQDKLAYIDVCRKTLHNARDAEKCVMEKMKARFEYEVRENATVPTEDDFLSLDFMIECFEAGRTNLYSHYVEDRNTNDKIMKLLVRIISVIINYEKEEVNND